MSQSTEIHMSRLAEWMLQTFGRAIGWSTGAAVVCGIVGGASGDESWLWLGAVVSPLVFAGMLATASSPLPYR